jgi:hypothetical protein
MRLVLGLSLLCASGFASEPGDRGFLSDLLHDQAAIWTSPAHIRADDLPWLLPLAGATAALLATDATTAAKVSNDPNSIHTSHVIADAGSGYAVFGASGLLFLGGAAFKSPHEKSAGAHAIEALLDVSVLSEVLKLSTVRQRPLEGNHQGDFFKGGSSFPSGHSIDAWALAAVVAGEYDHPLVKVGAFTYATAVAVSRFTGRDHFASDVLVGSSLGYLVGHFVEKEHHPRAPRTASFQIEPEISGRSFGINLRHEF